MAVDGLPTLTEVAASMGADHPHLVKRLGRAAQEHERAAVLLTEDTRAERLAPALRELHRQHRAEVDLMRSIGAAGPAGDESFQNFLRAATAAPQTTRNTVSSTLTATIQNALDYRASGASPLSAVREQLGVVSAARTAAAGKESRLDAATRALFDQLTERHDALTARLAELEDDAQRDSLAAASRAQLGTTGNGTGSGWSVGSEPGIYRGENGGPSFVKDMTTMAVRGYDRAASDRLEQHRAGMRNESRALNTTDGTGGDFAPPNFMVDKFVKLARAGRVTAGLLTQEQLPAGYDSFKIPKIATGTAVAVQSTQNTGIQFTDATTATVGLAVNTLAGGQIVSVQSIEQSPINFDQVILQDLAEDYAVRLNTLVLTQNVTDAYGLLAVPSGVNAVTYTDGTPTVGELYPKLNDAIQRIQTARFMGATAIVMHPRRWAWLLSALDSQGRPLAVPAGGGPNNALAGVTDGAPAQGYVGSMLGLPVYVDALIPTNLGAGTNEDRILIGRWSDAVLYESTPRLEAFRETKADQLSVLLRLYNYAAFTFQRYPAAFAVISSTGLVTPTF